MAKKSNQFVCQSCDTIFSKWNGRCSACSQWDSLVEITTEQNLPGMKVKLIKPQKISDLKSTNLEHLSTGLREADNVLGGGIVIGSLCLLAGDPGVGKSTLVLQIASQIAKNHSVLYISGEESAMQIKMRAERLTNTKADFDLAPTTDADQAIGLILSGNYKLIVIDSIQTMSSSTLNSAAGTISQITNNTNMILRAAKISNTAVIIIGHVTKEGNLAGPKALEHLVDVVLYLEGEKNNGFKILRGVKNRFGSTDEVGIFEMTDRGLIEVSNPSRDLLDERQKLPGSVVFAAVEGSRVLLTEAQALVSTSVFGYPKRTAVGVDLNRLNMLCAVASKRGGLNLSNQDVYVNIVGGLKIIEPAIDLAIILAIASSFKNISVEDKLVVFGEVGLSGEIRSVSMGDKRLNEAKKLGFDKAIIPPSFKAKNHNFYQPKDIASAIKLIS
ncbi:MAG: DNA repair protein RadA [bacterium]|nr:DNA repair protein RadA [bacterium]